MFGCLYVVYLLLSPSICLINRLCCSCSMNNRTKTSRWNYSCLESSGVSDVAFIRHGLAFVGFMVAHPETGTLPVSCALSGPPTPHRGPPVEPPSAPVGPAPSTRSQDHQQTYILTATSTVRLLTSICVYSFSTAVFPTQSLNTLTV